ncbi:NAD-binding protein [Mycena floridula]|nr:NAD-binding protein [Mycena floridula]
MAILILCKAKVDYNGIPDLSDKVAIVTGGILDWGKKLASPHHGAQPQKGRNGATGAAKIDRTYSPLHLTSSGIKSAAEEFLSGIMFQPVEVELTATRGHNLTFGINLLRRFCLTKLLMLALLSAFQASGDRQVTGLGCMILISSMTANIVHATKFARRYGKDGIVSRSLNPGANLGRNIKGIIGTESFQIYSPERGAITQMYAGTRARRHQVPVIPRMEGGSLNGWKHKC